MKQRLKGVLLMLPLILTFFAGNIVFTIFTLLLGIIGFMELKISFVKKGICIPFIFVIIVPILLFLTSLGMLSSMATYVIILSAILCLVMMLLLEQINIVDFATTILSVFYAFVPFWLISRIYAMDNGIKYAVLIFVISFSTDIFACVGGKYLGKHKLIPNISPKKTIEGSICGIVCTIIVGIVYGYCLNIPMGLMIPMAAAGSVIAQLGDLFASTIKRYCDIKDFSNLIPGHGGVLDRFDSVNFVALLMSVLLFL